MYRKVTKPLQKLLWKRELRQGGPGCPHGMKKVMRTPAAAYDIEEWMLGLGRCSQRGGEKG